VHILNYYEELGIAKTSSIEEIKSAYRQLALKYHPDRNPGDKEAEIKFKKIAESYEILSDPQKRQQYDTYGTVGRGAGQSNWAEVNVNDIFSNFFGRQQYNGEPGDHIVESITVNLNDVLSGKEVDLHVARNVTCDKCKGAGGTTGACTTCHGSGSVAFSGPGMQVIRTCHGCGGKRVEIKERCDKCKGSGHSHSQTEEVVIVVPPGVENGVQMCFKGQGHPGKQGGPSGHLYVVINVESHPFFERLGHGDLLCKVPVSYTQLVFGAEIEIPSLGSKAKFKMPPHTQDNTKFKLHKMGVPKAFGPVSNKGDVGDIIIEVKLDVPRQLSANHKILLEQLAELNEENVYPVLTDFKKKVEAL
jgi:molecular chaperone DnaJ